MFATRLEQDIDNFIPIRKTGTRDGFPSEIRCILRKHDKLCKHWSRPRSGRPYDQSKFIECKLLVKRVSERAYEKYLGDILGLNNDSNDQDAGEPTIVKTKTLYSLLNHSKQDSTGIAPVVLFGSPGISNCHATRCTCLIFVFESSQY